MKCFVVEVTAADRDGWDVVINGLAPPEPPRRMRRLEEFPQASSAGTPPAGAGYELCHETEPSKIREAFTRIASGSPRQGRGDVAAFGRYLFQALLGDRLWRALQETAGAEPIELALSWREEETDLQRLPWEAMHSGQAFLTAEPGRLVAITRLVRNPAGTTSFQEVKARVLFVVGASLTDPELRPAAEYLGLMRRLESSGLGLSCHLLLQATEERVKEAVQEFQPSVVHFIGHGAFSGGSSVLKLVDSENPNKLTQRTAEQLAEILRPPVAPDARWKGPAIVVLNACYSGQALGGVAGSLPKERARPLAAELVRRGIPLVVGMGGRVADRACRIFTRLFYEKLLLGNPVAGIAAGRRAGHGEGASPEDTLDWAMPVLFRDPAVELRVGDDAQIRSRQQKAINQLAGSIDQNPAAFCDRLACLTDYQELVAPVSGREKRRVMMIYDSREPDLRKEQKLGLTRLLEELSLQATRNGHVPCLVKLTNPGTDPPVTLLELAHLIRKSILLTRQRFELPRQGMSEISRLREYHKGSIPLDRLDPTLQEVILDEGNPTSELSIRCALRLDLLQLRVDARAVLQDERLHVLLLIDDLQRFKGIEQFLSESFLTADGLGVPNDPIPVIVSFCKSDVDLKNYQTLAEYVERLHRKVSRHQLTGFEPPDRDRFPYEQYLLHLKPPRVAKIASSDPDEAEIHLAFEYIYKMMEGVPSFLRKNKDYLEILIDSMTGSRLLIANDEQWLEQQERERGS